MTELDPSEVRARWRYAIVGSLFAHPPKPGELKRALDALADQEWNDPVTGRPGRISARTLEDWYYRARNNPKDPVAALRRQARKDRGRVELITEDLADELRAIRRAHPGWSMQLVADELAARLRQRKSTTATPSYPTIRRWMVANGLKRVRNRPRKASPKTRETRRYEAEHSGALWHLDFHHTGRRVTTASGRWESPVLLVILDDHTRLVCHAQWYLSEDTDCLVHAFQQALMKHGVPRSLLSDNGSAMTSAEFTDGLSRLGIVHETTLPYSPHQNGKQERFFGTLEGRLMALLEAEKDLSLAALNHVTMAWLEKEYHVTKQREMESTPRERHLRSDDVLRPCPGMEELEVAFTRLVTRRPQRGSATITLEGKRFEIPHALRHRTSVKVRYRAWDLSKAWLVDPRDGEPVIVIRPEDVVANADGLRRSVVEEKAPVPSELPRSRPALLQSYLDALRADGLGPTFIPKEESPS